MGLEVMEAILEEMKAQTAVLLDVVVEIQGLRADMEEAREKAMADSMLQVLASLKGTPLEGMMASMMSKMKAGGSNG
jgi:hypothetical protein